MLASSNLRGRFPKRRYGQADWLALVSVILRRPLRELQDLLAPTPSKRYGPGQHMVISQPRSHITSFFTCKQPPEVVVAAFIGTATIM